MEWKNHYEEIKFKKEYLLPSTNEIIFIILTTIFNIFVSIGIFFYDINVISFLWFLITSIFFSTFIFKFILIKIGNFKIFKKKYKHNLIGFKQYYYKDKYINNNNNAYIIFFVTWTGEKIKKDKLDKAIYFHTRYEYLNYLKKYKLHKYIVKYIIKSFIFTALAFHGLVVLLTNTRIDFNNQSIVFLFALIYIIYIISITYMPYMEREQNFFFKYYIKDAKKKDFLVDDNLERIEEGSKKSADVLGIVFGVLFSLYVTIVYNIIYTTDVNLKYISLFESKSTPLPSDIQTKPIYYVKDKNITKEGDSIDAI